MESSTSLHLVKQTLPFDAIPMEILSKIAEDLRGPDNFELDIGLWNKFACLTKTTRVIARFCVFKYITIEGKSKSKYTPHPMSNSEHLMKFIRLLETPPSDATLNIARCDRYNDPISIELTKLYNSFVVPHWHKLKKLVVANKVLRVDIDNDSESGSDSESDRNSGLDSSLDRGGPDPYSGLMATLKQMRCKNVLETLEIKVFIAPHCADWDPELIEEAWEPLAAVLTSDPSSNPWPDLRQVRLFIKSDAILQDDSDTILYQKLKKLQNSHFCPLFESKKFKFSITIDNHDDKTIFSC
ncbi:hypothetical protein CVT24_008239 [Panaeolus cyanescens]|uniref:Uncharacterized protein n=1 Tax=Panaeolus cyanescens TaxID=181874 RepID=A0A409YR49_9AGAR|nr:hypothetical protein CVT24_008239 [Panaeolus cyanescens]